MFKRRSTTNTLPQLGELELKVLEVLWLQPDSAAKKVRANLVLSHKPSLSTVQSTLERLYKKGILDRNKQGHAYFYRPLLNRAELLGRLLGGVIRQLHNGTLEPILSGFVDFAHRMDEQTLERLEQLIQRKKDTLERVRNGEDTESLIPESAQVSDA